MGGEGLVPSDPARSCAIASHPPVSLIINGAEGFEPSEGRGLPPIPHALRALP